MRDILILSVLVPAYSCRVEQANTDLQGAFLAGERSLSEAFAAFLAGMSQPGHKCCHEPPTSCLGFRRTPKLKQINQDALQTGQTSKT